MFGLVAVALLAVGFNWWLGQRSPGRPGSRAIAAAGAFRIRRVPTSYEAIFKVDTHGGATSVITTEKTWVHRPFESRIATWSGTKRLRVRQSAFGALANFNPTSQ